MTRAAKITILGLLLFGALAISPSLASAATRNPKTSIHRQFTKTLERHSSVYESTICLPSDCRNPRETFSLELNANEPLECF